MPLEIKHITEDVFKKIISIREEVGHDPTFISLLNEIMLYMVTTLSENTQERIEILKTIHKHNLNQDI